MDENINELLIRPIITSKMVISLCNVSNLLHPAYSCIIVHSLARIHRCLISTVVIELIMIAPPVPLIARFNAIYLTASCHNSSL